MVRRFFDDPGAVCPIQGLASQGHVLRATIPGDDADASTPELRPDCPQM